MIRHIERNEIEQLLAAGTPVTLVEALPEKYYRDGHLPGAINLPHDQVRQHAPELLRDKGALIVVYCANKACQNSAIAANELEALGYSNVAEYAEGKQDWVEAGLALERLTTEKAA